MAPMREMVKNKISFGMTWTGLWIASGLCILGDLNGWIRDRTRPSITSAFGVPGENDNCKRVVEFCTERGLCVGNIF